MNKSNPEFIYTRNNNQQNKWKVRFMETNMKLIKGLTDDYNERLNV